MEAKFVNLIITTLWLSGGFGVLLSLLYMGQYRRRNWWSIGNTVSVPRTLLPLYGALLLFCSGLALQAYLAQANVALWVAGGWALMALLFAMQGIGVALQAAEEGWDAPLVAQPSANGLPSGALSALALFFLLVNGGLVGWRALAQYEDGAFDRAFFWRDERAAVTSDAVAQPTVAEGAPARQASAIDQTTTGQANAAQATTALSTAATAPADAPTKAAPPATTGLPRSTAQLAAPAGAAPAIITAAPAEVAALATTVAINARTGLPTPPSDNSSTLPGANQADTMPVVTATPPTAPATLAPTVAPAPAVVEQSLTIRSRNGANFRRGPSLDDEVIIWLPNRLRAMAIGRTPGGDWLYIRLDNDATGWVSTPLTALDGSVETLPVVE